MASREEIGALVASATLDVQPFQEGVSGLKRQLAVTKSEFKAASANLGSFGDDTDKLKLKADSLTEQMQIQEKIVGSLNTAYEESATTKGTDAKATQDLVIKLNNAKATLGGMKDQLTGVNIELEQNAAGMNATGAATEKAAVEQKSFADSVEGTKKGLEATKLAMGGMMAVMAGGLLAEWSDGAEKMAISLQKLQIETGDSQPSLERLAVVASGAGVSTDQLATMIGKLDMRVSNATLGTKSFASGLNDLGISAQKFAEANLPEQATMIADAVQKSTMPTKQLDSALKNIGISAQNLGAAAKGNIGVISGSLARASQEGSTLGRALAQAGIDMNTFAGADIETKLQILGKHFEDTKDKAKATALVMQVFGKSGQDMLPLIQNFAELDDYAKSLKMPVMDTKEIQLAAEKTKMLQTAMQMMMDSVLVKILPLVDKMAKAFYDLAANIGHPAQAVKDFVKEMGAVPAIITGVVTAFAAMKIVTGIVGTITAFKNSVVAATTATKLLTVTENEETGAKTLQLAGWIRSSAAVIANTTAKVAAAVATGAMTVATTVATAATTAFGVALDIAMGPVGLIIAGVAALALGVYELITHWQAVVTFLKGIWQGLIGVWQAFVEGFNNGFTPMQTKVQTIAAWIGNMFYGIWNTIKTVFNGITQTFKAVWDYIGGIIKIDLDVITGIFTVVLDLLTGHWGKAWSDMKLMLSKVWNDIKALFGGFANDALQFGENFVKMIGQGIMSGIHFVEDAAKNVVNKIKSFLGFGSPTEDGPGATSDQWMPNLMNMLVDGIRQGTPMIHAALSQVIVPPNVSSVMQQAGQQFASGGLAAGGLPNVAQGNVPNIIVQLTMAGDVYGMDDFENKVGGVLQNKVVPTLNKLLNQPARQQLGVSFG